MPTLASHFTLVLGTALLALAGLPLPPGLARLPVALLLLGSWALGLLHNFEIYPDAGVG